MKYSLSNAGYYDLYLICDTKTGLIYMQTTASNGGGLCSFNRQETNHDGDVIIKQYTLTELESEYQQTQSQSKTEIKIN